MPNGLLLIDKPTGLSSAAVLNRAKRILEVKRLGHTGTLDPFASGLLVALAGQSTRIADIVHESEKSYLATLRFGAETTTLDPEGDVVAEGALPTIEALETTLGRFRGRISQVPPIFSALKVQGERSYARARAGLDVDLPVRTVHIAALQLESWAGSPEAVTEAVLSIRCGTGTYVRSLARDLGLACGSRAYLSALRRTAVGPFAVADAACLGQLNSASVLALGSVFGQFPHCAVERVNPMLAQRLLHGRSGCENELPQLLGVRWLLAVTAEQQPVALFARSAGGGWTYRAVFSDTRVGTHGDH